MSTPLLAIPVVVPIFGAALSILVGIRRELQRLVTIAALSVSVVVSIIVLIRVDEHGHLVANSGGWSAPLGIALVVDRFAAIMLVVSTVVLLIVAVYAIGQAGEERERVSFHPLYLVLASGVSASFVTGDLFNLCLLYTSDAADE